MAPHGLGRCVCAFYFLQGWCMAFPSVAVLMVMKTTVAPDSVQASWLQSLFVVGWCLKPLYGALVDWMTALHDARWFGDRTDVLGEPLTWALLGCALQTAASGGLATQHRPGDAVASVGVYVAWMVLSNVGASLSDVVVDGVQVKWIRYLDTNADSGRCGSPSEYGGAFQSVVNAARLLGGGFGALAGAELYTASGAGDVWLWQTLGVGAQGVCVLAMLTSADHAVVTVRTLSLCASPGKVATWRDQRRAALLARKGAGPPRASQTGGEADAAEAAAAAVAGPERAPDAEAEAEAEAEAQAEAAEAEAPASDRTPLCEAPASDGGAPAARLRQLRESVDCARMVLFMFLYHATPSMSETWAYYTVDSAGLGLQPRQLALLSLFSSCMAACGSLLYTSWAAVRAVSRRRLIVYCDLVGSVTALPVVLLIARPDVIDWTDSWAVAAVYGGCFVVADVVSGLKHVPIMHASAAFTPRRSSTRAYSVIMTAHNVGGIASGLGGGALGRAWGVTEGGFGDLLGFALTCHAVGVLSVAFVALIPREPGVVAARRRGGRGYSTARARSESDAESDAEAEAEGAAAAAAAADDAGGLTWVTASRLADEEKKLDLAQGKM
jgi:hypothetical protein